MLVIVLLIGTTISAYASTDLEKAVTGLPEFPKDATIQAIDDGNGVTYYIKSYIEEGTRKVEMTSEGSTDVVIITNDNMETFTVEKYSLVDEGALATSSDDMYIVDEKVINLDELSGECSSPADVSASLSYGAKTYEHYRDKYYYARGVSSYGNSYLKIGCVAEYDIKYWSLSDAKQAKCDDYTQEIRNVNNHKSNAIAASSVTTVALMCAALFAAPVITAEIAAALITVAVGFYGYSGQQVFAMTEDYYDAVDIYAVIKTYPHL